MHPHPSTRSGDYDGRPDTKPSQMLTDSLDTTALNGMRLEDAFLGE